MSLTIPARSISRIAGVSSTDEAKQVIMDIVGPALPKMEVMLNMVLVAQYFRPNKVGQIHLPDQTVGEDQWQGKVGLVLKLGPQAFGDAEYFGQQKVEVGEWVVYKVGDAWEITVKGAESTNISCRLVRDSNIRMKVKQPDIVI